MQGVDHIRVIGVIFTAVHKFQQAAVAGVLTDVKRQLVKLAKFCFQFSETSALHTAGGALEAAIYDFFMQADDFEKLGAPITGNGGDAHFGGDLEQAFVNAFAILVPQPLRVDVDDFPGLSHFIKAFVCQIRVDCRGAITDQYRKVVGIACRRSFHNDVGVTAQTFLNQSMMDRAGCQ